MKFLIIAQDPNDGILRSFHDAVFSDSDQIMIHSMLNERFKIIKNIAAQQQRIDGTQPTNEVMMTQAEIARSKGLTGNACENCGGFNLVRTGTCETCQDCHWNKGCG